MLVARLMVCLSLVWGALVAARVEAQPAEEPAAPAPVRCFEYASEDGNLDTLAAKELCIGATNDAPARCFEQASEVLNFSELQAVPLCRAASSMEPARCAQNLEATTPLEEGEIVAYCAATSWPLVAPPTGGSPACVQAALAQAELTDEDAVRLCRGSASTRPAECYAWGEDQTTIAEDDLVDLCAPVVVATPYTNRPYAY